MTTDEKKLKIQTLISKLDNKQHLFGAIKTISQN